MGTLARPHIAIHREMDGQECPSYERIRVFKQSLVFQNSDVDARMNTKKGTASPGRALSLFHTFTLHSSTVIRTVVQNPFSSASASWTDTGISRF